MPFTGDTFAHLFDWEKDPQRQEKIINARIEAELDGIDTGLSSLAAESTALDGRVTALEGASDNNTTILFGSGGTGTVAAGATRYIGAALLSATEGEVVFPLPLTGTLRNLAVLGNNPGTPGETLTCTLRVDLADTALVATIVNGTNLAQDTTHTVAVTALQRVAVKLVNSASGATQGPVSWSCEMVIP